MTLHFSKFRGQSYNVIVYIEEVVGDVVFASDQVFGKQMANRWLLVSDVSSGKC